MASRFCTVKCPGEVPGYLNALKRQAFNRGLDLVMLSIHQGFVFPDKG